MIFSTGTNPHPSRFVHIHTMTDVATIRAQLLTDLFGGSLPSEVGSLSSVTSPVAGLTGVASCQKITMSTYDAEPRVWTPSSSNGKLMIMHQGHSWSYNDGGYDGVLQQFLTAGFIVCGCVMPGGADYVTSSNSTTHNSEEEPLGNFVGPVPIVINTLAGSVDNIYMCGISGGGWTTTLAAAADVRIEASYPIAGSLPLYMPVDLDYGTGYRDWEQKLPGLRASYLDLYLLGAALGRRQEHILHDEDPVAFNRAAYDTGIPYAEYVAALAAQLGGDYDLVWRSYDQHLWNTTIVAEEILAEIS